MGVAVRVGDRGPKLGVPLGVGARVPPVGDSELAGVAAGVVIGEVLAVGVAVTTAVLRGVRLAVGVRVGLIVAASVTLTNSPNVHARKPAFQSRPGSTDFT